MNIDFKMAMLWCLRCHKNILGIYLVDANRGWVIGVINRNIHISRLKYDAKIKTKVAAGKSSASSGGHESPVDKVAKASAKASAKADDRRL